MFVARINDLDLYPDSGGSCRHVFRHGLRIFGIFRIDESGNASCLRHQFAQQSEAFGTQAKFSEVKIDAGRIPARSREASNKTKLDGIVSNTEQDWNGFSRSFCRECRRSRTCDNDGYLTAHKVSNHRREPIVLTFGTVEFDGHVATINVARFG